MNGYERLSHGERPVLAFFEANPGSRLADAQRATGATRTVCVRVMAKGVIVAGPGNRLYSRAQRDAALALGKLFEGLTK